MGFLDFTPEPPAPSATPVTEHIDLNLTHSQDTRDLSSKLKIMFCMIFIVLLIYLSL